MGSSWPVMKMEVQVWWKPTSILGTASRMPILPMEESSKNLSKKWRQIVRWLKLESCIVFITLNFFIFIDINPRCYKINSTFEASRLVSVISQLRTILSSPVSKRLLWMYRILTLCNTHVSGMLIKLHAIAKRIRKLYYQDQDHIKRIYLEPDKSITITQDSWTFPNKFPFIFLTWHFITQSWALIYLTVCITEIKGANFFFYQSNQYQLDSTDTQYSRYTQLC